MLHYILQAIAFQLFFLIIYDVFLKKETFFNWNRVYLLITAIASITLPFIKLESMKTIVPDNFVIRLPEVIIGTPVPINNLSTEIPTEAITSSSFIWSWEYLLYAGMIFASLILLFKIIKLSMLIQNNTKRFKGNLILVHLLKSNVAFSCFHYVFLGEYIREEEKEAIIAHEAVHVNQKHTWDLILFEILRIVFWFNPLIYIYQNRMTVLHEYIADAKAVKNANKKQYYQNLLSQVFDTQQISFTNTFYKQSLIKKRIVMLSKSKSHRIHLLKYALLIPMVFGMLMYTSMNGQEIQKTNNEVIQELPLLELVEKYYQELLMAENNNDQRNKIFDTYMLTEDKYILSKDEVAKQQAFFNYLSERMIDKKRQDRTLTNEDVKRHDKMVNKYKTYQEYLDYMGTQEAKSNWESNMKDGVLRLVVGDIKNYTEEEKLKQQQKIDLILKDDYFHTILITDGKVSTKMVVKSVDGIDKPSLNQNVGEISESYGIEVPFSVIEEVPTFQECKALASRDEIMQCTSNTISDFVNKNFNTNLAKELGLPGRQRINVIFKIDTEGNITSVRARAPHPKLEEEAIRVVKSLPKMSPGIQKGKAVVVPYSLPILFEVSE